VYRFGKKIVDDWEGKVNAWPLDEKLIDYVDASYGGPFDENEFAALNFINTRHSRCRVSILMRLRSRKIFSRVSCTRQTGSNLTLPLVARLLSFFCGGKI
jgi:hypothetical protein